VELLRPGMTREQVRFALGSPTLTSIFHADRWDYPYLYTPGHGQTEKRLFTVYFVNDRLDRWEGDEQPDRQPFQQKDARRALGAGAPAAQGEAARASAQESAVAPAREPAGSPRPDQAGTLNHTPLTAGGTPAPAALDPAAPPPAVATPVAPAGAPAAQPESDTPAK